MHDYLKAMAKMRGVDVSGSGNSMGPGIGN